MKYKYSGPRINLKMGGEWHTKWMPNVSRMNCRLLTAISSVQQLNEWMTKVYTPRYRCLVQYFPQIMKNTNNKVSFQRQTNGQIERIRRIKSMQMEKFTFHDIIWLSVLNVVLCVCGCLCFETSRAMRNATNGMEMRERVRGWIRVTGCQQIERTEKQMQNRISSAPSQSRIRVPTVCSSPKVELAPQLFAHTWQHAFMSSASSPS